MKLFYMTLISSHAHKQYKNKLNCIAYPICVCVVSGTLKANNKMLQSVEFIHRRSILDIPLIEHCARVEFFPVWCVN